MASDVYYTQICDQQCGKPYLGIEANYKEASLALWSSRNAPTLWWLPYHTNATFHSPFGGI